MLIPSMADPCLAIASVSLMQIIADYKLGFIDIQGVICIQGEVVCKAIINLMGVNKTSFAMGRC